jgi:two-component system, cell cycle response regulator
MRPRSSSWPGLAVFRVSVAAVEAAGQWEAWLARTGADEPVCDYGRSMGSLEAAAARDLLLIVLAEQNSELVTHLHQVAGLATTTAWSLGLAPAVVERTRLAAELHDIGKVAIPTSMLFKAGPLDPHEREEMERHSEIGERILLATPSLAEIAGIVRAVHERPDGTGYPDGLMLNAIPISARVIAVADSFDAMTHNRPYRAALPVSTARAELERMACSQFDPACVAAFNRAFEDPPLLSRAA